MDLKVNKESENKLLGRKEISFTLSQKGKTPTKEQAKELICKKLSLSPELTVIVNIKSLYGSTESEIWAHSYSSKEAMAVEKKFLFERETKKQAKAAKDAPAPEAAPAAAEEKKEEKKEQKAEHHKEEHKKEAEKAEPHKEAHKKEEKPAEEKAAEQKE